MAIKFTTFVILLCKFKDAKTIELWKRLPPVPIKNTKTGRVKIHKSKTNEQHDYKCLEVNACKFLYKNTHKEDVKTEKRVIKLNIANVSIILL